MDKYEFEIELKRLAAISPPAKTTAEGDATLALAEELWRKFSHVPGSLWNRVVSWVIEHHKTHFMPKFPEFVTAYGAVKPTDTVDAARPMTLGEHEDWLMKTANAIDPFGADEAMKLIEKNNVSMPTPILQILMEKQGQYHESKAALSSVATAGMATTLPAIIDDEPPPEE